MGHELFLTTRQVAYFADVAEKAVKARTRCKPGETPLTPLDVPGIPGTSFAAPNVVAVWPKAGTALLEALGLVGEGAAAKPATK